MYLKKNYNRRVYWWSAVVDGYIMEFKTITGSLRQVEVRYKEARVKAVSFISGVKRNWRPAWLLRSLGKKNPGLAIRRLSGESRIYRNAPDS